MDEFSSSKGKVAGSNPAVPIESDICKDDNMNKDLQKLLQDQVDAYIEQANIDCYLNDLKIVNIKINKDHSGGKMIFNEIDFHWDEVGLPEIYCY